ncbi:MAG: prepilin-type N-terminal cleavage/methylation domain-containing protein, partial [Planctomycetota bacterium]
MRNKCQYRGFSLTEVLLAVATLAIGMVFISGTFLTGIHFSTISTERSIAAVVADEAFAKIKVYGIDFADPNFVSNQQVRFDSVSSISARPFEFAYPSTNTLNEKHYFWSALCRPSGQGNQFVQVTVFVGRKLGATTTYQSGTLWPVPVQVGVSGAVGDPVITITDNITFINDGYTIVENGTGHIYRVVERGADPAFPEQITLARDKPWQGG